MTWERDGYLELGRIIGDAELRALHRALDRLRPRIEPGPYGILHHNLWLAEPDFERLLFSGRLAEPVLRALRTPEIRFFQDNLVWKPPGTAVPLEWHQDYSYWPLSDPHGATLWLALDDVDASNGCMRYVPGSHLQGERQAADFVVGAGQPRNPDLEPLRVEHAGLPIRDMPLRAGEAVIHDPLLWHMSSPNRSTRHRRAWSITFVLPGARWDPGHAPHPYEHELSPPSGGPVEGARFPVFRRGGGGERG